MEAVFSGLVVGVLTIIYSHIQFSISRRSAKKEEVRLKKVDTIASIVAYRKALTQNRSNEMIESFNSNLSVVPIYFSQNKEIMDKYRDLGNEFTSKKYYDLVILMMCDAGMDAQFMDQHLLENVPSINLSY